MGGPGDDDAAMRARLKDLTSAVGKQRKGAPPNAANGGANADGVASAMNLGFRVVTELVVAVLIGAAIGWAIDHWLGSSPFGLIVFIALGTAAGFWNIYRIAARPTGGGMTGR